MADFKTIPLKDILPDPNQPRKFYDATSMQELTESVKQKGVLQPILIRPIGSSEAYIKKDPAAPMVIETRRAAGYKGPEFLIVCGERRFRASNDAGLPDVPAVIKSMTDEEALELQIIENLQRKDVHPMEEAVAFKSLLDNKSRPLTAEEIAAKVGKSVYFIKQRLKLNALSTEWQQAFYLNKLGALEALHISQLSPELQAALLKDKTAYNKGWEKDNSFHFQISSWDIERRQMKLNKAPFDKKDETLNPKMGACTNCPFNSAVSCLFPDDAEDPRCNNATCFNIKTDVSFDRRLKEHKDNPDVVFVDNENYRYDVDPVVKKLSKEGHKVYLYHKNEYQRVNTSNKEYKKDLESGKVLKAFVVAGTEKGGFIYISFSKKSSSSSSKSAAAGKASAADIDAEIQRLQDVEKRKKELDAIKVHQNILSATVDNEAFKKPGLKMQPVDRTIMLYLLLNEINGFHWGLAGEVAKLLKFPERSFNGQGYQEKYFEKLAAVTDDQLAFLLRFIVMKKWGNPSVVASIGPHHWPMLQIAKYLKVDIAGIQAAQNEIAKTRSERVKARIEQQQALKSQLKQKAKPAAKKQSTKSNKAAV